MSNLLVADLNITSRFCVFDINSGHYIHQYLDLSAPGDLPPDIASMPVVGLRSVCSESGPVLYIDVYA